MKERKKQEGKSEQKERLIYTAGEDTIAAISTAFGEGGIGIVRMSGDKAREILTEIFAPEEGSAQKMENRKLTYGAIKDPKTGEIIDEVLAVFMKGPNTYTCEDVVEIDCHGSAVSLRKIMTLTLTKGARLAEKGEFTKRAFLNGRLDLSQAEAVADLVSSNTEEGLKIAVKQLKGSLSDEVNNLRRVLMDTLVSLAVNIDYPDEDIEELAYKDLEKALLTAKEKIQVLLRSAGTGRIIKEGLKVSIVGKPNVGKSSLLNALLGEARAIVTDIPGTTRDAIAEFVSLDGIPVHLVDTAGIRETVDEIERIGIEKSRDSLKVADLVFFVVDGSAKLTKEDEEIAKALTGKKTLLLLNKQDLGGVLQTEEARTLLPEAMVIRTSFTEGEGLKELKEAVRGLVYGGKVAQRESTMVTNARHEALLVSAKASLDDAIAMTKREEAMELIEIDVRNAYETLGEILGETLKDDIVDEVFSRFCLGK